MSTASFDLAQSIPGRIRELLVLTQKARDTQEREEELYNAICRSTCVLLASHLEGFLKDLTRSIIGDLTYNLGSFAQMPTAMQRTFCQKIAYYESVPSSEIEGRIKQLISFFSRNSVTIDMSAFTYKESLNKNPNSEVIDSVLERLGVPSILSSIAIPAFEAVFDNDRATNYRLNRDIVRLVSHLYAFPFKPIPKPYSPVWVKSKKQKGTQTLWHSFIEDVMTRRHTIAHGDTLSNDTSWEELQRDAEKMRVLMYGVLLSATSFLSQPST
jgi:hypothetical protein